MAELSGLAAVVTGGGSGIGLATARLLAERGANVAVLDRKPGAEFIALTADVTDDASVRLAVDTAADRLGGIDIAGEQRGRRRDRHGRRQRGRRVAPGVRRQRDRDRPGDQGRAAVPARLGARRRRQHLLDRGDRRPAAACAVLGDQGRRACRSRSRWPPTTSTTASGSTASTRAPPTPRGLAGCSTRPTTRRPSGPRSNARQPMGRLVTADEVAAGIAYLASPLAASVTGTALAIDGGMAGLRIRPRA